MASLKLAEILTEAYSERWTSADVRAGNCSLDLCHSSLRRKPSGELARSLYETRGDETETVYYEPKVVLWSIFDGFGSYWASATYGPARQGKVDAQEARHLWAEWQVRTGRSGRPYAYQFLQEVGLPVEGGLLVKGELDLELAKAGGITRREWEKAVANRTVYIRVGWKGEEGGFFVTCWDCGHRRAELGLTSVHFRSPWEVKASEAEAKIKKMMAHEIYGPVRRPEWDCPHIN